MTHTTGADAAPKPPAAHRARGAGRGGACLRVSGEVGVLVTGAFDLEEMWIAGERDGRVPHRGGVVPAGDTGEHGSEEVDTVDVDGGVPTSGPTESMPTRGGVAATALTDRSSDVHRRLPQFVPLSLPLLRAARRPL